MRTPTALARRSLAIKDPIAGTSLDTLHEFLHVGVGHKGNLPRYSARVPMVSLAYLDSISSESQPETAVLNPRARVITPKRNNNKAGSKKPLRNETKKNVNHGKLKYKISERNYWRRVKWSTTTGSKTLEKDASRRNYEEHIHIYTHKILHGKFEQFFLSLARTLGGP